MSNNIKKQEISENSYKIINVLKKSNFFIELSNLLNTDIKIINIKKLEGALKSASIAALASEHKKDFIVIVPSIEIANDWLHDLQLLFDKNKVTILSEPKKYVRYDNESTSEQLLYIVEGLSMFLNNDQTIGIATPDIFDIELPNPENLCEHKINIQVGETTNFDEFVKSFALNGFIRKDYVEQQGDIAVRGGIVDIFPLGWENPLRIEFWGDTIESIREFDLLSQRSISNHINTEFIGHIFDNQDSVNSKKTIINYLKDDIVLIIDSPDLIAQEDISKIPDNFQTININKITNAEITINSTEQPNTQGSIRKFVNELKQTAAYNNEIFICADGKVHIERLKDLVLNSMNDDNQEVDLLSPSALDSKTTVQRINWFDFSISNGFVCNDIGLSVFNEHQVFNRQRAINNKKTKKIAGGITLRELKQLNHGDLVVHVDKGIGRFDGFETLQFGDNLQECVRLLYQDGDTLYVSLNYIQKIQKYSAQEGVVPKLSKLGSSDWERKKNRAKKKLKDIARDLIKLYAERKNQPGFQFPMDTIWQKEFEAAFIYEDTPDQARTTQEIKADMESATPMDRLVCGDVGFGKTEIAIRAAFKAVQAGKQVGVLVPTTVLAEQHYMTFHDRLSNYPVNIKALSRFRTPHEQKQILERLYKGNLDIVIGTHRILSKDVKFKDLGLLIVDEEHRFGVGAKEKLRQIRANVDTLTLTATPIPRTLNFSLMGARDLSVIETPPRNRLPIYTEVIIWNEELIRKAIHNELERGGQIFFVNDRINDLDLIARNLKMLMPTIRFGIAHGQMKPEEIEKIMKSFISKKIDVLISTKIVESGLDIPNANTILINKAQNFGMAELYQLRGRVGRKNLQAYCYLIIPPAKTLPHKTLRRLQAIEEFTELGSGMQLAMRDLEIRGAGNLLGPEQSGYINEIGFDMFHKILDEAMKELREEEFNDLFKDKIDIKKEIFNNDDISIDLDSNAFLTNDYIDSETERFYYYKQLYMIQSNEELKAIVDEIKDRYGKLPKEANELVFAVRVRIAALNTGLNKILIKKNKLYAELPPESNTKFYDLALPAIIDFINEQENIKLAQVNKKLTLEVDLENREQAIEFIWRIKKTLDAVL